MGTQFCLIFAFAMSFMLYISNVHAKIVIQASRVQFIDEVGAKENPESVRFKYFTKFKNVLSRKDCSKAPFKLDGNGTYASLNSFSEYLEKADFKVAPDKKHAVVFSTRCERACSAAENTWKCNMHATVLDNKGYVLGDIEGDFLDVELRPDQSEILLLRSSAGGEKRYAEVYDFHGKFKNKIEHYPQP